MNDINIIVFDFETGGLNPMEHPPIQIAAMVVNPRTLDPIPNATFNSIMCPPDDFYARIQDDALRINKKTKEEIKAAPAESVVWKSFTNFVSKYKTDWRLPIPCGKNIRTFDLIIAERLCKLYGPWSKKYDRQDLFNMRVHLDLEDYLFSWFEGNNELPDFKMDTIRPYFGLPTENAHDALVDVKQTWELIGKFLKLHRTLSKRITFKGACNT